MSAHPMSCNFKVQPGTEARDEPGAGLRVTDAVGGPVVLSAK